MFPGSAMFLFRLSIQYSSLRNLLLSLHMLVLPLGTVYFGHN